MTAKWVIELEEKPGVALAVIESAIHNLGRACQKVDDEHLSRVIQARLEELSTKILEKFGKNV